MRVKSDEASIQLSSNPDCPACQEKRLHVPSEWDKYHHPLAGTGHSREHGAPLKKDDVSK